MPIAVRTRQVPATGAQFDAPTTPIGINSGVYAAKQGLVNDAVGFAVNISNKIAQADMTSEMSDFEAFVNTQKAESAKFRMEKEDDDLPDGKGTIYGKDWEDRYKAIQEKANNLKYQDTRTAASQYLNQNKPVWELGVQEDIFRSRKDKSIRKFEEFQNTVLSADYTNEIKAENSIRKQSGLSTLTDKEYRLQLIKSRADELANSGIINQKDVPDILKSSQTRIIKNEIASFQNAGKLAAEAGDAVTAKKMFDSARKFTLSLTDTSQQEIQAMIQNLDRFEDYTTRQVKADAQNAFDSQISTLTTDAEKLYQDPNTDARDIYSLTPVLNENLQTDKNLEKLDDAKRNIKLIADSKIKRAELGPPQTDITKYNSGIDSLMKYYENLDYDTFKKSIDTSWYNAKLSDDDRNMIHKVSQIKLPYSSLEQLKEAISFGKSKLPNFFTGDKKDNERIAKYNKAMIDFIASKEENPPTSEEIFKESRRLYGILKNPPVRRGGDAIYFETPEEQAYYESIDTAKKILLEAGGDKEKARKIARERGFKF
jgi:hypothetical protein